MSELFKAGAGTIGNYSNCSFSIDGTGSFQGNKESNPIIGSKGELRFEKETLLNVTLPAHKKSDVLESLFKHHPYEEIAYELTTLENNNQHIGMGMIGELDTSDAEIEFLKFLKQTMNTSCIRHSKLLDKPIKKVAVLGGSGSFAIPNAIKEHADIFITADCKYHDFFKTEDQMLLADIGHYESEQFTKELLVAYLNKKITTFAVLLSQINTNPITYF